MCRKTVPQGMWRGRLDDSRTPVRTLERTLNALLIQMMTPDHTGPGVDGKPGCRKNILPAPLFRRFRILASQRERKPDIASPLLALRIMDSLHHGQMPPQRLHQPARQHGDEPSCPSRRGSESRDGKHPHPCRATHTRPSISYPSHILVWLTT